MKDLNLSFSLCDSEYFTALRLVASAVCNAHGTGLDALEDYKVCVTESALILKNCGFEKVKVTFGEDASCTLEGEGGTPVEGDTELSLALISALVRECNLEKNGEIIRKVILKL